MLLTLHFLTFCFERGLPSVSLAVENLFASIRRGHSEQNKQQEHNGSGSLGHTGANAEG